MDNIGAGIAIGVAIEIGIGARMQNKTSLSKRITNQSEVNSLKMV